MNRLFVVLIIFFMNFDIESKPLLTKGVSCKCLKKEIKKNWKFINDSSYYKTNTTFLFQLDSMHHGCLAKLKSEQIIKLFGKPIDGGSGRLTDANSVQYKISLLCPASNPLCGGGVLYFKFDENKKFSRTFIVWEGVSRPK